MWVWAMLALPIVAVVATVGGFRGRASLALIQDATPLLLLPAVPATILALRFGIWPAAVVGLVCVLLEIGLVLGHRFRPRTPRWVERAPTVRVTMGNVFVDNDEPDRAARQLVESDADVVVVVETTPEFREAFDRCGGTDRYPHRVFDSDDDSEYAVALYASTEPRVLAMVDIGALRAASATVERGGVTLLVLGVLPMATVDPGGYQVWRRQIGALRHWVRRRHEPLVIVGDFNTTVFRPGFRALLRTGLRDAHETLGVGLRPSFQLMASGPLAKVPVIRLDHALCNRSVWPLALEDLGPEGSDHRPFIVTLAIRIASGARRDG